MTDRKDIYIDGLYITTYLDFGFNEDCVKVAVSVRDGLTEAFKFTPNDLEAGRYGMLCDEFAERMGMARNAFRTVMLITLGKLTPKVEDWNVEGA